MSNTVIVHGRVTADPELRFSAAGNAVVSFSVADSRNTNPDKNGEPEFATTWFNCRAFKEFAEAIAVDIQKGDRVTIVGRLEESKYTDKDGNERSSVQTIVESVAKQVRATKGGGNTSKPNVKLAKQVNYDEEPF